MYSWYSYHQSHWLIKLSHLEDYLFVHHFGKPAQYTGGDNGQSTALIGMNLTTLHIEENQTLKQLLTQNVWRSHRFSGIYFVIGWVVLSVLKDETAFYFRVKLECWRQRHYDPL
jgi:hypothetical protein